MDYVEASNTVRTDACVCANATLGSLPVHTDFYMHHFVPQLDLFEVAPVESGPQRDTSTTFQDNLTLPVHRWFRYSAGFSAAWVGSVLRGLKLHRDSLVLDPFAGAGTTLLECEFYGVNSVGLDPHPFVGRVAKAKLCWRTNINTFRGTVERVLRTANGLSTETSGYPDLVYRCYTPEALVDLDRLRRAVMEVGQSTPAGQLVWLVLAAIIRPTSKAGTAQWQYVLPKKTKKRTLAPFDGFRAAADLFCEDMLLRQLHAETVPSRYYSADARTCEPLEDESIDCVITSPPYPNNFDYADATRLEMCFLREIAGWGDLQEKVRRHLVRACSQHVPPKSVDIPTVLGAPELAAIRDDLAEVCERLTQIRMERGGKKTYNNMIACYYLDMARVWRALRRTCKPGADVCFVIGDSAPYGIYAPAIEWMGRLALSAGFETWRFEKTRDRNVKWKNRKHRVPLQEGRLWVKG